MNRSTTQRRQAYLARPPASVATGALAALGALCLFSVLATTAAAAPRTATDVFAGAAVTPAGQTSPIQVDPRDLTVRTDGAVGLGYTYQASGLATGQLPGSFTYEEHGYLYFANPADPTSLVGSRFVSGVFSLDPGRGRTPVRIADTAPEAYTSGIQTAVGKLDARLRKTLAGLLGKSGPLTYGYFTFTNPHGTYTGYATPDFSHFAIQITFDAA
jgi:hypothetical protein